MMTLLVGVAGIATSYAPDRGTVVLSDWRERRRIDGIVRSAAAEDASYAPDVSEPLCPTNKCHHRSSDMFEPAVPMRGRRALGRPELRRLRE